MEYSRKELPKNPDEEIRVKSAKIAVVFKTAAGTKKSYLLGLQMPKDILTKLEEINEGSSTGIISGLQRQFLTQDSERGDDYVAATLSQLKTQIGGVSAQDRPTKLSKKDVLLR